MVRAILLDHAGNIVESSTANVLVYFANEGLVTPRREYVLPGISLLVVTELARDLDIPLTFRDITPAELSAADEIMLTSSSVCALPVVRCDGRTVGKGTPGQIYRRLLAAWSAIVEVDIVAQAKRFACR